jgi:hypothetical protein
MPHQAHRPRQRFFNLENACWTVFLLPKLENTDQRTAEAQGKTLATSAASRLLSHRVCTFTTIFVAVEISVGIG